MLTRIPVIDHEYEARLFKRRAIISAVICLILIGLLLFRLAWLQIIEYAHFSDLSENNRIQLMALPPNRGLIFDRNGVVLADNRPAFHLEIIPEQVDDLDSTLESLGKVVTLSKRDLERFDVALLTHRSFESISLRTRLNDDEVANFAVNRHRFPGVDINARISRYYPQSNTTVHALGYVGRINEKELAKIKNTDPGNYHGTIHIGKLGVEKYYEKELHGVVGQQNVEVNAEGRVIRVVDEIAPVPGENLILTIDLELQKIAEDALGEFAGAVVAMDPNNGEILAFVSKPAYDPNLFVHGISETDFNGLLTQEYRPLLNRALSGQYPPGSTFKPFIGLAALEFRAIKADENIRCKGYYLLPDDAEERKYRDWKREGHGSVDFGDAMEQSCDVYYYELAYRLGIDKIYNFLSQFGFGKKTGVDLENEKSGLLPSRDWKKRVKRTVWYPGETIISGIGQGYMLATPLQLVTATSILATKGQKVNPHLLKSRINSNNEEISSQLVTETITLRNAKHWRLLSDSMKRVLYGTWGTARATGYGMKYKMVGKTGTAQVFGIAQGEEYDEENVAKHLRDHGMFIAYAPAESPTIVVAAIAENGEHGSMVAHIVRAIIDEYLLRPDG